MERRLILLPKLTSDPREPAIVSEQHLRAGISIRRHTRKYYRRSRRPIPKYDLPNKKSMQRYFRRNVSAAAIAIYFIRVGRS